MDLWLSMEIGVLIARRQKGSEAGPKVGPSSESNTLLLKHIGRSSGIPRTLFVSRLRTLVLQKSLPFPRFRVLYDCPEPQDFFQTQMDRCFIPQVPPDPPSCGGNQGFAECRRAGLQAVHIR